MKKKIEFKLKVGVINYMNYSGYNKKTTAGVNVEGKLHSLNLGLPL